MNSSQEKKQEIEKKIQAIEQRFDKKLRATRETIELGKSPQKFVSKRPIVSLFLTFSLGLLAGRVVGTASTRRKITSNTTYGDEQNNRSNRIHLEEENGLLSNTMKQRMKSRITQKIIDSLLNYAEHSFNDYLRRSNSVKGSESKK